MEAHYNESEQFVKLFLTQLKNGAFEPNERLPTESVLAEQYGISKTNVHLAIQKLARLGILRVVPRHAIYVCDPHDRLTLEALDAMFYYLDELPARPVLEAMLELRNMMAAGVIQWMANHPDPEHLDKLTALLNRVERAETLPERQAALTAFYACIYQESGNEMFEILLRSVPHSTRDAVRYTAIYADTAEMVQAFRAIFGHIAAADAISALRVWLEWSSPLVEKFIAAIPD